MSGLVLAGVWFGVIVLALFCVALAERRARIILRGDRPELLPPRRAWGGDPDEPPGAFFLARALASAARLVRVGASVTDQSQGLLFVARGVSCLALASGLALVPFANHLGGAEDGLALVVFDLRFGLLALVFFVFLAGMAQVGIGLAHRSIWARLGSIRVATRMLGGIGLLMLVLAPLAIEGGSLRLADLVHAQQDLFAPLPWLAANILPDWEEPLRRFALPRWHLLTQPITALLFIPAMGYLTRRPVADDPVSGGFATSGFGFDADPTELYWGRVESRLALILFASLFVALFLGAGQIPYLDSAALNERLATFVGTALPSVLVASIEVHVFFVKLLLVLALLMRVRRVTARLREDQWLRIVTRRLLPIAWANLLLTAAIVLLADSLQGGAT
ncbi:MAG: NADH-quinone oxidoreductase subunit H [Myxococcota bacterium]